MRTLIATSFALALLPLLPHGRATLFSTEGNAKQRPTALYVTDLRTFHEIPACEPSLSGKRSDEPTDGEVSLRFRRREVEGGGEFVMWHRKRVGVRIVKEKIADYIDPPRTLPFIGPAQAHHMHFKCTAHYTDVIYLDWPFEETLTAEDATEVVYIDVSFYHIPSAEADPRN